VKFLLDAQLSRKLAAYLVERGHDAVHVATMPHGFATPDAEITAKADQDGRVVVSKDVDFVKTHVVSGKPEKLLAVRIGNSPNSELLELFGRYLNEIVAAFAAADYIELHRTLLVIHSTQAD